MRARIFFTITILVFTVLGFITSKEACGSTGKTRCPTGQSCCMLPVEPKGRYACYDVGSEGACSTSVAAACPFDYTYDADLDICKKKV